MAASLAKRVPSLKAKEPGGIARRLLANGRIHVAAATRFRGPNVKGGMQTGCDPDPSGSLVPAVGLLRGLVNQLPSGSSAVRSGSSRSYAVGLLRGLMNQLRSGSLPPRARAGSLRGLPLLRIAPHLMAIPHGPYGHSHSFNHGIIPGAQLGFAPRTLVHFTQSALVSQANRSCSGSITVPIHRLSSPSTTQRCPFTQSRSLVHAIRDRQSHAEAALQTGGDPQHAGVVPEHVLLPQRMLCTSLMQCPSLQTVPGCRQGDPSRQTSP